MSKYIFGNVATTRNDISTKSIRLACLQLMYKKAMKIFGKRRRIQTSNQKIFWAQILSICCYDFVIRCSLLYNTTSV